MKEEQRQGHSLGDSRGRRDADQDKFTPKFMREFNATISDFGTDIDCRLEPPAQLHARGIADNLSFIEGYGPV